MRLNGFAATRSVGSVFGTIIYVQFLHIKEFTGNYKLGLMANFLFPPECFPAGASQSRAELL